MAVQWLNQALCFYQNYFLLTLNAPLSEEYFLWAGEWRPDSYRDHPQKTNRTYKHISKNCKALNNISKNCPFVNFTQAKPSILNLKYWNIFILLYPNEYNLRNVLY
ncbi:hypothetical protein EGI26_06695 [Lacihabitans sp. CCS-44]|nr:hypothetical protein [Lacihabitans sp. CCS-44]